MENKTNDRMERYISPAGAWAFSLGTSIGWGSLVITCNTYLVQAGPMGSVLGMIAGALIMLLMARNYHYLMNCFPDAGGIYTYTKNVFGYDHGFLTAWFLALIYLAIFWANATSLPLFSRYFLGNVFQFGFHYTIFGYEVWLGEALLSIAAILLTALISIKFQKFLAKIMTAMVVFFALAITVCFLAAFTRHGGSSFSYEPGFLEDSGSLNQVVLIACISPWAFIGFENISHASEEFSFSHTKAFRILTASVIATTLLYIFIMILSVTAYPDRYGSWLDYMKDQGNLSGLEGLPAFYAAHYYMGNTGVMILILALLCLILTSLIGNMYALSRLFCSVARDEVLPIRFSALNRNHVPAGAVMLVACCSVFIPFLGRTAIGWIVDVTTIGATIVYGFVSAAALKKSREQNDPVEKFTGGAGLILMIGFGLYLLVPNLFSSGSMEPVSYMLFTVWAILGFLFFRNILGKDRTHRFGNSIVVWIALLSLILFTSMVWMSQTMVASTEQAMGNIQAYYDSLLGGASQNAELDRYVQAQLSQLHRTTAVSIVVVIVLFGIALASMLNNYSLMRKRAEESEAELGFVRTMANTDPLTGVKSKHAYAEAEKALNLQISEQEISAFAVVLCDVNGLKHVNDTQGHKAGDRYIQSACRLVCKTFQHSPVFRVGGDEFVVLLKGEDYEKRQELMTTLMQRSRDRIGTEEAVVASGISDYQPGADISVHDVYERADAEMYKNKKNLKEQGARTRD